MMDEFHRESVLMEDITGSHERFSLGATQPTTASFTRVTYFEAARW
jgi:hypothetical protein